MSHRTLSMCLRLSLEDVVLSTKRLHVFAQRAWNAEQWHQMMMQVCLDAMDDNMCDGSVNGLIEISVRSNVLIHQGKDQATESPAEIHLWTVSTANVITCSFKVLAWMSHWLFKDKVCQVWRTEQCGRYCATRKLNWRIGVCKKLGHYYLLWLA